MIMIMITIIIMMIDHFHQEFGKKNSSIAPVVQTLDSSIHRINHYPADKYLGNQLRYPQDRFLSGG